jgi:hypothetical protein
MMLKNILCQGLGKSVSNLILGVNGEYFDSPLFAHVCEKDGSIHLCAWFWDKAWEAMPVQGRLSCLQRPCNTHRAWYKEP